MAILWMTAFLDFPTATFNSGCWFWEAVTGFKLSAPRGASAEFATLVPSNGDAYLRVQRVGDEEPGIHMDLHVDDVEASAGQATALGAAVVEARPGLVVMSSPTGLPFCLVRGQERCERPRPPVWHAGQRSIVDQVCLDIPRPAFAIEGDFWAALTGWERRRGSRPEFDYLVRPAGMPLRLLLQRLDDEHRAPCRAHPDLACDDVPAERRRHEALGGRVLAELSWTTLLDPTGLAYCITQRDPTTGTLSPRTRRG
jgi:predicted enzyme related to lactoylglutathione lyase